MWPFAKKKLSLKVSLEDQLANFATCGITLRDGITIDNLLSSFNREAYESDPSLLATRLGGELEERPYTKIASGLWHFDTECIEDHGAYVRIAENMRDLASPHLPIKEISDYVDVEAGRAELNFEMNGKEISWKLTIDNDWADPAVFSRFVELLNQQTAEYTYTYLDLRGQDCLIGFATHPQRMKLNKLTGLNFVPLT